MLAFTDKPPTAPGFYWWRRSATQRADIVRVGANGVLMEFFDSTKAVCSTMGGEWAGPLSPPGYAFEE